MLEHFLNYRIPLWILLLLAGYVVYRWLRRIWKVINPSPPSPNNIEAYQALREQFFTGDVIAFQGTDFFAGIIQKFTKTNVSHVGLVIRFGGFETNYRNYILESVTDKGVCLIPLSLKLSTYKGKAWWYPLKPEQITDKQREAIYKFLMKQLGAAYDFKNIFDITKRVMGHIMNLREGMMPEDSNQMICSELCGFAFKQAGLIDPSVNASSLRPVDIVQQPFLQPPSPVL